MISVVFVTDAQVELCVIYTHQIAETTQWPVAVVEI